MVTSPNIVEVFLIVDQPRQRLTHWVNGLAALSSGAAAPFHKVLAHYESSSDRAILQLCYLRSEFTAAARSLIGDIAQLLEVRVIEPGSWPPLERDRFTQRIAACEVAVTDRTSIADALAELARRTRANKANTSRRAQSPVILLRKADVKSPFEKTSVDAVESIEDEQTARRPNSNTEHNGEVLIDYSDEHSRPIATTEIPPMREAVSREPELPRKSTARFATVPAKSGATSAMFEQQRSLADRARTRETKRNGEVSALKRSPAATEQPPVAQITARFLRGGKWLPARIGAISLKGVLLLTGALPRIADVVTISISYGERTAVIRGRVVRFASDDLAGTSGFAIEFERSTGAEAQLMALLTAAKSAKVTIDPPPPRTARRLPVEWPVHLGTSSGPIRADALDVSLAGMFLCTQNALGIGTTLNFSMVLDDESGPIVGRARTVREVGKSDANRLGIVPGYGVVISEMGRSDHDRWQEFLKRVAKRSQRRVLLAANPLRVAEYTSPLIAAGYAVSVSTDASAFAELAQAEARPLDVAIVDRDWTEAVFNGSWVQALLAARSVPMIGSLTDPRNARAAVDRLLLG